MPRTARAAMGGVIYHVSNCGRTGKTLFRSSDDFHAFVELLIEATSHASVEVFSFCLMPNYWHMILRPRGKTDLSKYMSWVANTHVKRYRARYPRSKGKVYQGRYESLPVQKGDDFVQLVGYIEAIPLRARLVQRAEDWAFSSLGCEKKPARQLLDAWPVDRPERWKKIVNKPLDKAVRGRLELSLKRARPLGDDQWSARIAKKTNTEHKLRPIGRPLKKRAG